MDIHYFAYGSNLCVARLKERVPGAVALGPAELVGHDLHWHKRSQDGSAKCSVLRSRSAGSVVHGFLFSLPAAEKPRLDRVEGRGVGYDEVAVEVQTDGGPIQAVTYVATLSHIDGALQPYVWYRDLVVAGAKSLGLPSDYVAAVLSVPAILDPNRARAEANLRSMPCTTPRSAARG